MHDTVHRFVAENISSEDVNGRRVLEVGSLDVNGSVRPYIESLHPAEYIGVDIRNGDRVDIICDACNLVDQFGPDSFDLVLCTEMLEHVLDWKAAIHNMKMVCKDGGRILLTTRSLGFGYHEYPGDYWRFQDYDISHIFADLTISVQENDTHAPGVLVSTTKPDGFEEVDLSTYSVHNVYSAMGLDDVSAWTVRRDISIAWIPYYYGEESGSVRDRVLRPHTNLLERGYDSNVIRREDCTEEVLDKYDVCIFHKVYDDIVKWCVVAGKVVILDVNDEYVIPDDHHPHAVTTCSIPNMNMYANKGYNVHYLPHGFDIHEVRGHGWERLRMVYCGYPENVHTLFDIPMSGLELAQGIMDGNMELHVITDLTDDVKSLIESTTTEFPIIPHQWNLDTYEDIMRTCNVALCPQGDGDDSKWNRKSVYKACLSATMGLPSIISSTEEAVMVFRDGINAFICGSTREWSDAVIAMHDCGVRASIAEEAMKLVESSFTLDMYVDKLLWIIDRYLDSTGGDESTPEDIAAAVVEHDALQVEAEFAELVETIGDTRVDTVLEIGSAYGGSLYGLMRIAAEDAVIISIDLTNNEEKAKAWSRWLKDGQTLHVVRGTTANAEVSSTISEMLDGRGIDLLHIDGDHTIGAFQRDLDVYGPMVTPGGIISVHDICKVADGDDQDVGTYWNEIRSSYVWKEIRREHITPYNGIGLLWTPPVGDNLPFISVVTPCYDDLEVLKLTLPGYKTQTYTNFELIVVDDGSPRDSGIKEYVESLGYSYYYNDTGSTFSISSARNIGIWHADGERILFTDSDMIPSTTLLEEHARAHGPDRLLIGTRHSVNQDALNVIEPDPRWPGFWGMHPAQHCDVPWERAWGCNISMPRKHLLAINGMDEDYDGEWGYDDFDLTYRLYRLGMDLIPIPRAVATHVNHTPRYAGKNLDARGQFFAGKINDGIVRRVPESWDGPGLPEPYVSVIITCYNNLDILKQTLPAWNDQYFNNFELIVVDDGSPQDSGIKEYVEELGYRYYWQEDRGYGISRARNLGVWEARGVRLLFTDSDIIPDREFISQHMVFADDDTVTVGVRHYVYPEDVNSIYKYDDRGLVKGGEVPWELMWGCNFSVHRDVVIAINGFDEVYQLPPEHRLPEDNDLAQRLHRKGLNMIAVPDSWGHHILHGCAYIPIGENQQAILDVRQSEPIVNPLPESWG